MPAIHPGRRQLLLTLVPALAAALWVVVVTGRYGVGLFADSADYVSAARSLLAGDGLVTYRDRSYTLWPPLYPLALAALGLVGLEPVDGARWLGALCFAGVAAVAGAWLARHLRSTVLAVLGAASVVLALPLMKFSALAVSEPLFWWLSLLAVASLGEHGRPVGSSRRGLYLSALFSALAFLTRYAGVTVVAVNGLRLLARRGASWRRRLGDATLYGVLSVLPTVLWLARNHRLTGRVTGHRNPSATPLAENLAEVAATFGRWLAPPQVPPALVLGVAAAVLVAGLWPRRDDAPTDGTPTHEPPLRPPALAVAAPWLAFAATYLAFVVVLRTLVQFNPLRDRLLSPVCVPLLLVLFLALDRLAPRSGLALRGRGVRATVAALLVTGLPALLLLHLGERAWTFARVRLEIGAGGYHEAQWMESDVVRWLRRHAPPGLYLSNAPEGCYFFTGQTTLPLPRNRRLWGERADERLAARLRNQRAAYPQRTFYLVWFEMKIQARRRHLFEEDALVTSLGAETVAAFDDGRVYRLPP